MTNNSMIPALTHKLPEFVRENYPNFVQYIRDYLAFLEQDENFLGIVNSWRNNLEPSLKVEPYIDAILSDLGFVSGQNLAVDKHLLIHLLRDFYLSRGNEASFRFLFRMLFNADVEIRYPRERMLVPSHAEYGERHFIFTTANNINAINFQNVVLFVQQNGGTLTGLTSKAKASIENIQIFHGSGTPYFRVEILRPNLEFIVNEPVTIDAGESQITEFVKPILDVEVVSRGSGYTEGDVVQVSGAMLNGYATIESTVKGGVDKLDILSPGQGHEVGDSIRARSDDDGFGFSAKVTEVDGSGGVIGHTIVSPGYNYERLPQIYIDGSTSQFKPSSSTIGAIQSIKVENPYVDFENATITISSRTGSGAVLRARAVSRWVTRDWADRKGFLEENSTLIDSDKVQQFSYSIVSSISSKQYESFVDDYLHPVGYVKSSSYEIVSNLGLNIQAGDIVIGNEKSFSYENTLTLNFLSNYELVDTFSLVTDLGEEIVTDLNESILFN